MRIIHKYALHPGMATVTLPGNAEILTVQAQYDSPELWALVEQDNPIETRVFHIFGTGWIIPDDPSGRELRYINTYQQAGGELVFHVFEEVDAEYGPFG